MGRITHRTKLISYGMKTLNKTMVVLTLGILTFSFFPDLAHESYGKQGGFLAQAPDFEKLAVSQGFALLPIAAPKGPDHVLRTVSVVVTAYSSTTWQTDDSPFITASGTTVREGVVAANFLPIGTRIKLPDLYGDKIFVVEDRMHPRQKYVVDIWFPSYSEALNFGAKYTKIQVIGG
jgi:3D (Asp-Asp-Asp) domain-containing protein